MRRVAILSAAACLAGCVDESFQVGDDGWVLPAPLEDLLPQAQSIATDWDDDAYLWGMGGDFTITDADGRANQHSYRFYSRRFQQRLDLHFFGGAPWGEASPKWPPPTPISVNQPSITSAQAVQRIVAHAESLRIEVPPDLTVRYFGYPVWPEPSGGVESDSLAWRVDFLEMGTIPAPPGQAADRTWFSTMTAYLSRDGRQIFQVILVRRIYPRFEDPVPPN